MAIAMECPSCFYELEGDCQRCRRCGWEATVPVVRPQVLEWDDEPLTEQPPAPLLNEWEVAGPRPRLQSRCGGCLQLVKARQPRCQRCGCKLGDLDSVGIRRVIEETIFEQGPLELPTRAEKLWRWVRPPGTTGWLRLAGVGLAPVAAMVLVGPLVGSVQGAGRADAEAHRFQSAVAPAAAVPVHIALPPAPPAAVPTPAAPAPAPNPANGDYLLFRFPSIGGLSAVAGDGDWSLLRSRGAVHWKGSAAPGGAGNMIIGFHREPVFKAADQLKAGDVVEVLARDGKTYRYRIDSVQVVAPNDVAALNVPSDGRARLTMVTCTPWWVDTQRLVIHGTLVG